MQASSSDKNEREKLLNEFFIGNLLKKSKFRRALSRKKSLDLLLADFGEDFGYKHWYGLFLSYMIDNRQNSEYFDKFFSSCDEHQIREFVNRLFQRIVFLCLIQQKRWFGCSVNSEGWDDGNPMFMQDLFSDANQAQKDDYLDSILKPLFFEGLSIHKSRNYETNVSSVGCIRLPVIDLELFRKTEYDCYKSVFPSSYFAGLFQFLSRCHFCIKECHQDCIQIDPEILGKIFESFMGRNDELGVYYTDKKIVQYMCKESLIHYLINDFSDEKGRLYEGEIRHLIENNVLCDRLKPLRQAILEKLKAVRICDPAVGAGAFPMGFLDELVKSRIAVEDCSPISEIKKEIIRNNLFCMDIDVNAIEIARLRFWLSVTSEVDTPERLHVFKDSIVQGNSLIQLKEKHFDIVVGNPPYGIKLSKEEKKCYKELYPGLSGNYDIYMAFFELGMQITRSVLCYITPDKWLSNSSALGFRKRGMVPHLSSIVHLGNGEFRNALVDAVVSVFDREPCENIKIQSCSDGCLVKTVCCVHRNDLQYPFFIDEHFNPTSDTVKMLDALPRRLGDYIKCEYASVNAKEAYRLAQIITENSSPGDDEFRLLITGTIHKYSNRWNDKRTKFCNRSFQFPVVKINSLCQLLGDSFVKRMKSPKIIMKSLNLLDASVDLDGLYMSHVATLHIRTDSVPLLLLVAAVINSSIAKDYLKAKYMASSFCGGQKFTPVMINSIPVPNLEPYLNDENAMEALKNAELSADIDYCEKFVNDMYHCLAQ